MTRANKTAKSALMIMILTLGSKLLGFLRETLIATKFGSGIETDTFFVALTATGLVTTLIMNSISTTFVPILSEVEGKKGKDGKLYHANNMMNSITLLSIILVILAWIFAPLIVRLIAIGFEGEQFNLAVTLTRLGLPMIIFSGMIGSITGFLHSEQRYLSSAAIGFPFNLTYIFFLLFLAQRFGIKGLMVTAVLAVISQFLIQVPEARKAGFRFKLELDVKDKYNKKALSLSLPVLLGVAIDDIKVIVSRTLASGLVVGSISALNYAYKINGLVQGVFVMAITTVVFPLLAKESNMNNIEGMKRIIKYGVNILLLITIPATVGLIILATPIVQVVFERGAFTPNDTIMTSSALIFYSVGLVGSSLRLLTTRVYYSLQDTKTPMVNGVISVGIAIVLNLILVRFMDHSGLALSTSISTGIATILMFYGLRKKIGSLGMKSYIKTTAKSGTASIVMGIIAYITYHSIYSFLGASKLYNSISLLVAVMLGAAVYGILCYLFKVEEVRDVVDKVIARLRKKLK